MSSGDLVWLTQDEREKLDNRLADLMNARRVSRGEGKICLAAKELAVIDEMAEELAKERSRKTTGTRTYKVHLHCGTSTEFEAVREISDKRRLT